MEPVQDDELGTVVLVTVRDESLDLAFDVWFRANMKHLELLYRRRYHGVLKKWEW